MPTVKLLACSLSTWLLTKSSFCLATFQVKRLRLLTFKSKSCKLKASLGQQPLPPLPHNPPAPCQHFPIPACTRQCLPVVYILTKVMRLYSTMPACTQQCLHLLNNACACSVLANACIDSPMPVPVVYSPMPSPVLTNACICSVLPNACIDSPMPVPVVYSPMPSPVLTNACACAPQCMYRDSPVHVPALTNACARTHQCL